MSTGKKRSSKEKSVEALCSEYGLPYIPWIAEPKHKAVYESMKSMEIQKEMIVSFQTDPDNIKYGKIVDILPQDTSIRKQYRLSMYSYEAGLRIINSCVLMYNDSGYLRMLGEKGEYYKVSNNEHYMVLVHSEEALPYDMRKWPISASRAYFRYVFKDNPSSGVDPKDAIRCKEILGYNPLDAKTIVQIRRINPNVSSRQTVDLSNDKPARSKKITEMNGLEIVDGISSLNDYGDYGHEGDVKVAPHNKKLNSFWIETPLPIIVDEEFPDGELDEGGNPI